ncbi:MAG: hypothetical protein ACOYM2_14575 [Rectinemataceae bacterium]
MGFLQARRSRRKLPAPDPLTSLYAASLRLEPEAITRAESKAVFESGDIPWKSMATVLMGSESPKILLLFRGGEPPGAVDAFLAGLDQALGITEQHVLRRFPAEPWRLEIERQRLASPRCLMARSGTSALLFEERPGLEASADTFTLDHPSLLALPALLCPREWAAGGTRAAVSWKGLRSPGIPRSEGLRWAAAWTSGASRMGFFMEIQAPRGSQAEAVAKAVEPILAAAWKQAWPGLSAALPGSSAAGFVRARPGAGTCAIALDGLLFAGASSLGFSLLLPSALLAQFPHGDETAGDSAIARFLAANDNLVGAALRAGKPPSLPRASAEVPDALPFLPSFLGLLSERDLARLVQGYFLPEHGALGFQALFFARREPAPDGAPGPVLAILPFDERRILASLPDAAREEWIEARRAGLPLVTSGREKTVLIGSESLKGLWEAQRKKRVEPAHGDRILLATCLGERIEAADRARLADLVSRDHPLALLDGIGRPLARRVLDRLSVRDLAIATWGSSGKRPLLEANLSQGKRAEFASEASVLARRLKNGEEAPGLVVAAREELGARMAALLKGAD